MSGGLIDTSVITYEVTIDEEALRQRLESQVLADLGLLREGGKLPPGVCVKTLRGETRVGGYRVRVTRDMAKDTTPRLTQAAS